MTKKYSLRWIDFHTNLYQSLESFLKEEELVDVTLTAGGKNFRAHKLILSICSPFFKDLFIKNPCEHPIVVLKEVEHVELYKLLQYIYHGEVHVTEEELNPFLETAEFLQIKGLASVREKNETAAAESNDQQATKEPNQPFDLESECYCKIKDTTKTTDSSKDSVGESIQNASEINSLKRSFDTTSNNDIYSDVKKARQDSDGEVPNESGKESKSIGPTVGTVSNNKPETAKDAGSNRKTNTTTSFKCVHCHRSFANSYNLKVHIQDKHDTSEGNLVCHKCHKHMKNPSCLRVHMYNHHKPVYRHHSFNYKP